MVKKRGFLLKHRVTTLFRRVFRRGFPQRHQSIGVNPVCGLIRWAHKLKTKAKAILAKNMGSGRDYIRVGQGPVLGKPEPIPKGHVAVYVGQKEGGFERILVPVVYFNHPLFGDLLKESENEYGFEQPGGFTIPCRVSEFELVQNRIKTVQCTRKVMRWKSPNRSLVGR